MASNSRSFSVNMFTLSLCLCFTIHVFFLSTAVTAAPREELESMLAVVRSRGYNLFGNAITTSDIYFDLLAGTSFTFFAPTDSSLFALDMTATASEYTTTLRYHAVPRRLSLMDLRRLPSGSSLPTLVPHHDIHVQRRLASNIITVDGVDVVVSGLFYGRNVAVHGLGAILSFRSQIGPSHGSSAPTPLPHPVDVHHHSPHIPANFYNTPPVVEHYHNPPPEIFPGDHDRHSAPPPPANLSVHHISQPPSDERMDNRTIVSPVPEPASFDPFSPADSPEVEVYPFDISPADGLWTEGSTVPALTPSIEQPMPSVPKADTPAALSPSIDYTQEDRAVPNADTPAALSPSIDYTQEDPSKGWSMTSTAARWTEIPWPFDQETIDCQGTESETLLGHVSVDPSNPLALHMSTRTCASIDDTW